MTEFVPHGYISVHEAVNRLGRELFPEAWTGEEYEARRGLISEEEWLKKKDLAPPRGGGAPGSAPGSAPLRTTIAAPAATALHSTGDPSSSSYQAEFRARKRYEDTCDRLRTLLEAGDLEAAVLDPFTGKLHRASTALWCRFDADRMIEKGRAPIPRSRNTGSLVVKKFPVRSTPARPLSTSRIREMIDALLGKLATESLTRPKQKDFVRKMFPNCRVTERQFSEIFQEVPVPTGRPAPDGLAARPRAPTMPARRIYPSPPAAPGRRLCGVPLHLSESHRLGLVLSFDHFSTTFHATSSPGSCVRR
jgi:hypothetical protein